MRSAFLIGATGNIGGHLLRMLAPDTAAGTLRIRVAARNASAARKARGAGAEPIAFDLACWREFDAALDGSDTVFLLRPYTLGQIIQGKQVIDAAARVGVRSLVVVGAHGHPDTPYPIIGWNFLVEAYAERSGIGWTHLRPNFFMENILAQRDPASGTIFNRLTAPVSWAASEDIAAVAAAVIRDPAPHHGRAYSIATDVRSIAEIAELFTRATGRPHGVAAPPRDTVMAKLIGEGREPAYAEPLLDYIDAINTGLVPGAADTFDTVASVAARAGMTWERFVAENVGGHVSSAVPAEAAAADWA